MTGPRRVQRTMRRRPDSASRPGARQETGWEHQADDAAAMFIRRGRTEAAVRRDTPVRPKPGFAFTPAPAATFRLPASVGEPLPLALRHDLERFFDAELSAVRIHRDGAASEAAREVQAHAFTAGRDIYFDGTPCFDSEAGRRLLAHEVAHALQQTGRRDSFGRLAATPAEGMGAVQCKGGSNERRARSLDLDKLAAAHKPDDFDAGEYDALVTAVRNALGSQLDETGQPAVDLEAAVVRGDAPFRDPLNRSPAAAGFLFDVLKFIDRYDGAATILQHTPLLMTCAAVGDFIPYCAENAKLGKDEDWLDLIAPVHPLLSRFWPKRLLDTLIDFLYGSAARPNALRKSIDIVEMTDEHGATYADAVAAYAEAQSKTPLQDNELVAAMLDNLNYLDKARKDLLEKTRAEAATTFGGDVAPLDVRLLLCGKILWWGRTLQSQRKEMFKHLGEQIVGIAQKAQEFWLDAGSSTFTFELEDSQPAENDQAIRTAQTDAGETSARQTQQRRIPNDTLFTNAIPQALARAITRIGALTPGSGETSDDGLKHDTLPSATAYASQLNAATAELRGFVHTQLEAKMTALAHRGKTDGAYAMALAGFLLGFGEFFRRAAAYSVAADQAYARDFAGRSDVRFAHRLRLALYVAASMPRKADRYTAWQTLLARTHDIEVTGFEDQGQLAILGEWTPDPGAPVSQLAQEFGPGLVFAAADLRESPQAADDAEAKNDLSVSGAEIANLYLLLYSTKLSQEIERRLQAADAGITATTGEEADKPLLNLALKAVNANDRPLRYVVSDWDYADGGKASQPEEHEDKDIETKVSAKKLPSSPFLKLLENHPKTQSLYVSVTARSRILLYPVIADPKRLRGSALFAWSVPPLASVLARLRDSRALRAKVAATKGLSVEQAETLSDVDWLTALTADSKTFDRLLSDEVTAQRIKLDEFIRRAVNRERKLTVEVIGQRAKAYAQDHQAHGDVPGDVSSHIAAFGNWALPKADQQAQVAALVLGIAPLLPDLLQSERRFEITSAFYGWFVIAIAATRGGNLADLTRVVPDATERAALIARIGILESIKEDMDKRRSELQKRFGFKSEDGQSLMSFVYAQEIKPKQPFTLNGVQYVLESVHRKFAFHPPSGYANTPTFRPAQMDGREYGTQYQPVGHILFVMIVDGRRLEVDDSNIGVLSFFSNLIEWQANIQGLNELAEINEQFAQALLDGAELVPGLGQAVMAANIIRAVLEFLGSGEWDELKKTITEDPHKLLEDIAQWLERALTPENVWIFLLFGSPLLDQLASKVGTTKPAVPARRPGQSSPGKLAKLVAGVRSVGRHLRAAWEWLETHVGHPVRALQSFVLARPALAMTFGLIAQNLYRLEDVQSHIKRYGSEGGISEAIDDAREDFAGHMQNVVNSLQDLPLPQQILPIQPLAHAVIDVVLSRLGRKGKITRFVLDKLGVLDQVSGMIAGAIEGSEFDPNKIWRTGVIEPLNVRLKPIRDALVDDVFDLLTGAPLNLKLARPALDESFTLHPEGEGFTESEPFLDEHVAATHRALPARPGPGMPLPPTVRGAAEQRLGHDFAHVRLHTGASAAPVTGALGAAGLTTGSHVFLDPSVSLHSPRGRHILDHELTHVLQQTGVRPLGGVHSATPRSGREGAGLHIDPAREAAAERVASAAGRRRAGTPVDPGPTGSAGFQPSIGAKIGISTVKRFLNELSVLDKAIAAQHVIDREPAKPDIDKDLIAIGKSIWEVTFTRLQDPANLPGSFPNMRDSAVAAQFKVYVTSIRPSIEAVIPQLTFAASEPVRVKTSTKEKETESATVAPKRTLQPAHFVAQLESYLMARAGIVCKIKLRRKSAEVEDVRVTNLLLVQMDSNVKLWKTAMLGAGIKEAEFNALRPLLRDELHAMNTRFLKIDIYEGDYPPDIEWMWQTKGFAIADPVVKAAKERRDARGKKGRPDDLPPVAEYTKTHGGGVGLRIGTHQDLSGRKVPDRESHHTTQFLLIEYFRNRKEDESLKPFRQTLRGEFSALGAAFDSAGRARSFKSGKGQINFERLDDGARGGPMPAILIASKTHDKAGVHVSRAETDDFPNMSKASTQGERVRNQFLASLRGEDADELRTAIQTGDVNKLRGHIAKYHEPRTSEQIFDAIQATYAWMHNIMDPGLANALVSEELKYYRSIVVAKHRKPAAPDASNDELLPDYDLKPGDLLTVHAKAMTNNNDLMSRAGWSHS